MNERRAGTWEAADTCFSRSKPFLVYLMKEINGFIYE